MAKLNGKMATAHVTALATDVADELLDVLAVQAHQGLNDRRALGYDTPAACRLWRKYHQRTHACLRGSGPVRRAYRRGQESKSLIFFGDAQ